MKKRVAFITHYPHMGGAEIFLLRILPKLRRLDAKVFFIGESGPMIEVMRAAGIDVEHLPLSDSLIQRQAKDKWKVQSLMSLLRAFFDGIDTLAEALTRFNADLVYTNSAKAHVIGAAAARKNRTPTVSHVHDALSGGNFRWSNKLLLYWAIRLLPNVVVTNSIFSKRSLGRHFWRSEPLILDCPIPDWKSAPSTASFPSREIVFGAVNRITPWKGQDRVISHFNEARNNPLFRDAKLLIVGSPGSLEDEVFKYQLWDQAKKLNLTQHVEFRPFMEEVELAFDEIDVVIHDPKTPEPFGQSILEAQSRGCVVFTTGPSGADDFIEHGVNGFVFSSEDKSVDLLKKLMTVSADELQKCSEGAVLANQGRFMAGTVAKHLESLISIVLPQEEFPERDGAIHVAHLDHETKRGGAEFALEKFIKSAQCWDPKAFLDVSGGAGVFSGLQSSLGRQHIVHTDWHTRSVKSNGKLNLFAYLGTILSLLRVGKSLRKNLEFAACDVIHANTTRSLIAAVAAKMSGQKLVFHIRDDLSKYTSGYWGSAFIKHMILRRIDALVANSKYSLDSVGKVPDRVLCEVISSPIGSSPLRKVFDSRETSEKRDNYVICMIARISPWKGQLLLLEAFAEVIRSEPNSELWLAGSGDFESTQFQEELMNRAKSLNIFDRIKFLGHVSDIPTLLESVDICVQFSTRPEPMGQNVLQYLAAGKATIVAAEGGPKEWVEHMVNGLLCKPRDKSALAESILLLLSDKVLRSKLEVNARQVISTDFDEKVIAQFGELVVQLSQGGNK